MKLIYKITLTLMLPLVLTLGMWGWLSYRTMSRKINADTDLILICPVCREIVLREGHLHETLLGDGDAVGGARVYSLSGILKLLDRK